jgi:histidyl-tRNA synthetase
MRQNYPYHGVKGMKDVFPEESRRYQALEQRARDLFARYGCGEIRTPYVEQTILFERGVGQGTDIVNKEMFYVPAKDEEGAPGALRRMVLRPEATASVARAYVEHEIDKTAPGLQRYFYLGPMFRYERPQKGRLRQFSQIGVELIGSPSPALDAEAMVMLHDFFTGLPLGELTFQFNSVGDEHCRPGYIQTLQTFARARAGDLCPDCRERIDRNPLRLFDCKQPACRAALAQAPSIQDRLCPACRAHQAEVLALLGRAGVTIALEPRLMRGLDYYTRTVFEITSRALGAQNAVAAGGRYNGLIAELDGPPTPAVGWSLGVERLLELLPAEEAPAGPDVFVVDPGADPALTFLAVTALRRQGVGVVLDHDGRSAKALMKQANRALARFALFVVEADQVELKNMATGEQERIRWADVPGRVRSQG